MKYIRNLLTVTAVLAIAFAVRAEIPAGYYASLANKTESTLKTAVRDKIYAHKMLNYDALFPVHFKKTDVRPGTNPLQWWDMYSSKTFYVQNGWSGMNREHSFPKSWWGGDTDLPAYTDLNHLYPSESKANTAKNNYPLGIVAVVDFDNGVSKVGTPVAGQGGGCAKVFEPDDEYKGDFARTYFYMVTCYQDVNWRYTYMAQKGTYPSLNKWAQDLLLAWHRADPVSQKEIDRNEAVYAEQGNRNPFIDLPELAEYIWGNKRGQAFSLDDIGGTPELITPWGGSTVSLGEVAQGVTLHSEINLKGKNLYGSVSVSIYGDDAACFSLAANKIPAAGLNTDEGYNLAVTFTGDEVRTYTTNLVVYDGGLSGSIMTAITVDVKPVPTLTTLAMLDPTDVTATGYRANWTAAPETIDHYLLTRTIYYPSSTVTKTYTTVEPYYDITDMDADATEDLSVQSSRLGVLSDPSPVLHINPTGVESLSLDRGLSVYSSGGEAIFRCRESHTAVVIYNMAGQVVASRDIISNDDRIALPVGVYIVRTAQLPRPIKIAIR